MEYRYNTTAINVANISDSVYRLRLKPHSVSETDLSLSSRMRGRGETFCGLSCLSIHPYSEACFEYKNYFNLQRPNVSYS